MPAPRDVHFEAAAAALHEAQAAQEAAQARMAALQHLTAGLARAASETQIARCVADEAAAAVGASFANLGIVARGDVIRLVHSATLSEDVAARWSALSIHDRAPISDAIRTDTAVYVPNDEVRNARYPHTAPSARLAGLKASASVPLHAAEGRVIGAVGFAWPTEQRFDTCQDHELHVVAEVCAPALERAQLYEAERRARRRFQRVNGVAHALAVSSSVRGAAAEVTSGLVDELDACGGAVLATHGGRLGVVAQEGDVPPGEALCRRIQEIIDHLPSGSESVVVDISSEHGDGRYGTVGVVPVVAAGSPLGALVVGWSEPRAVSDDDRWFLEFAANQWGQALRRLAEDERQRETVRVLELLLREAPIGFALFDEGLRFRIVNERLASMNGVAVADHLGHHVRDVVPDLERQAVDLIGSVLATREPLLAVEVVGETAASPGERRVWEESLYPVVDGDRVVGVGAVVLDVTDQRRLTEAERRSRDRLELLRQLSSDLAQADSVADVKTAAQRAGRRLGARRARFALSGEQPTAPGWWPVEVRDGADVLARLELELDGEPGTATAAAELADPVAGLLAAALSRVLRREREHSLAITLQRSLLPEALPDVEHSVLAATYLPGEHGLEVGGDWYDAVDLPAGSLMLAVGDVAGRGERAAAAMGRVRNAFRLLAFDVSEPASLLERMNELLCADAVDMSTAVIVKLDARRTEVHVASAGHLPPVLFTTRSARLVELEPGPPLGVIPTARFPEHRIPLAPEESLLLYSDGLVERRGEGIDTCLERLLAAVAKTSSTPAADLPTALTDELLEETPDDVVVLVVAPTPAGERRLSLELPADPSALRGLRRDVRRWLRALRVDVDAELALVLAVTEAATNAMLHAYGPAGGKVRVRGDHRDGLVVVEIEDEGAWRPDESVDGRGLGLIRALTDAEIVTGDTGTLVRLRHPKVAGR